MRRTPRFLYAPVVGLCLFFASQATFGNVGPFPFPFPVPNPPPPPPAPVPQPEPDPKPVAPPTIQNGDANGDGVVDMSDAIVLLNHLFLGGPAPVEILCEPEPTKGGKMRFLNDLTCNAQGTLGKLELCDGSSLTKLTSTTFSECQDLASSATCSVKVSASTPCGSIEVCGNVATAPDLVYDFVLSFNGANPVIVLFVQPLGTDGSCPPVPVPGMSPTQVFEGGCSGAGGGAALDGGAAWGQEQPW